MPFSQFVTGGVRGILAFHRGCQNCINVICSTVFACLKGLSFFFQRFYAIVKMSSQQSVGACGMCGGEIPDNDRGYLHEKGAETIKTISKDLKDGMEDKIKPMTYPILIHKSCRKTYVKPSVINAKKRKRIESKEAPEDEHINRSRVKKYNPYTDCCLCNEVILYFKNCSKENPENYNKRVPTNKRDHRAETTELSRTIMKKAKERNDAWGRKVMHRLTPFIENSDLVALEAKLHGECQVVYTN